MRLPFCCTGTGVLEHATVAATAPIRPEWDILRGLVLKSHSWELSLMPISPDLSAVLKVI